MIDLEAIEARAAECKAIVESGDRLEFDSDNGFEHCADLDALIAEVKRVGAFRKVGAGIGFGGARVYDVALEYEARIRELAEQKADALAEVERLNGVTRALNAMIKEYDPYGRGVVKQSEDW